MPRTTKTVILSVPYVDPELGFRYDKVILREPSAAQFFEFGPLAANYMKNDVVTSSDLDGVLQNYLRHCVVNVDFAHLPLLLRNLPLIDGIKIRRTFASFFDDAINQVLIEEGAAELARQLAAGPLVGPMASVAS